MTDEQIDLREFKRLRNYYRKNFRNGVSDESFLVWCEIMTERLSVRESVQEVCVPSEESCLPNS